MSKFNFLYFVYLILISQTSHSSEISNLWDIQIPNLQTNIVGDSSINFKNEKQNLFDKIILQGVPPVALEKAFNYFNSNIKKIKNKNFMTIIDFSQHSSQERKYIIDLKTGDVEILLAAHGRGSDPHHSGFAETFSNIINSKMTSLGFYLTAESYHGKYGLSMRLDGLESTNNKARERAIVVHGADYVNPKRSPLGRSWGCPAVEMSLIKRVVQQLKDGSLYYIWHPDHN